MMSSEEEDPEPGTVNGSRSKCCCSGCEQVMDLDPAWTHEKECPLCGCSLFAWACETCYWSESANEQCENPPFPDIPCSACDRTPDEIEAEKEHGERHKKEKERIERAVEYRRAERNQQHRSKIAHTWNSWTTQNPKDIGSPRNIADALRMHWGLWERLRPLVIEELGKQRLPPSVLTLSWARRLLSFFERSFLADNCAALRCGVLKDVTGTKYYSITPRFCHITLQWRMVREGFAECEGAFPTVPRVRVQGGTTVIGVERPWKVAWEPDLPEGSSDPREIYKTDGDKTLNFYEFILWTVRLGFALPVDLNEKYFTEDKDGHSAEPIAYVPAPWVGRPKMWAKERDGGFPRWIWMRDPVIDWSGQGIPQEDLVRMSEENMRHCCVCYGLPPEGQELIMCECGDALYCSDECQRSFMEVHKFHPNLKHPKTLLTCLACGEEKTGLSRCGRCKNAMYCDVACQKGDWKQHKKQCLPSENQS